VTSYDTLKAKVAEAAGQRVTEDQAAFDKAFAAVAFSVCRHKSRVGVALLKPRDLKAHKAGLVRVARERVYGFGTLFLRLMSPFVTPIVWALIELLLPYLLDELFSVLTRPAYGSVEMHDILGEELLAGATKDLEP